MPFTLSHPAAAIPLLRTRLVPSALIIGCMAPDYEYFARLEAGGGFGHTLPGLIAFDLPVSLLALWLFHVYAKEPIYTWLPESVRQRFDLGPKEFPARNGAQFALVALSILIGTVTHILWDSFTHRSYWLYNHWQFLHNTIQLPLYGPLEYVRVLQHASTIIGAIALLTWFWIWFRNTAPTHPQAAPLPRGYTRSVLLIVCLVALVAAVVRGYLGAGIPMDFGTTKNFLGYSVVTAITVFWLGVVLCGAYRGRSRGSGPLE